MKYVNYRVIENYNDTAILLQGQKETDYNWETIKTYPIDWVNIAKQGAKALAKRDNVSAFYNGYGI